MDPTVVRALQRAAVAFLVTFVVGSGVVFAVGSVGGDGTADGASPTTSPVPGDGDGDGTTAPATTPNAHLVWMPGGIPEDAAVELTTLPRVRRVAVGTAGVAWLARSLDEDREVVDAPPDPFRVPLEVTGVLPGDYASFLPGGEPRDLLRALTPDQAILSSSAAKVRGLGVGATLELDPDLELEVAGVLPDVLVGGYEIVVVRQTAEQLGAGLLRYALLRMTKGATPTVERLTSDVEELVARQIREPAIEVRLPGQTELLRAHDRSPTPAALKRRFGEFAAYPDSSKTIDIADTWIEENIEAREVPRLGTVTCHRRTLGQLRKAMTEIAIDAPLGSVGPCFDETWRPDMPQGTLPAALWGAAIRLNVGLNIPGNPPLMDDRIVETMQAWGFRWAGEDAYPDGSLFENRQPPPRDGEVVSPSPTD